MFAKIFGRLLQKIEVLCFNKLLFGAVVQSILFYPGPFPTRSCTLQVCSTPLSQGESTRLLSLLCHSLALFSFICFMARCLGKAAQQLLLTYRCVSDLLFLLPWEVWDFSNIGYTRDCLVTHLMSGGCSALSPQPAAVSWGYCADSN